MNKLKFPEDYTVWDLETSGLDPKTSDILEIGIMVFEKGEKVSEHNIMLNHKKPVPDFITEITGISTEMCEADGVNPKVGMMEAIQILKFTDKDCHNITHNGIKFDIGFFTSQAMKTLGYTYSQLEELEGNIKGAAIDTAAMFKGKKMGRERMYNESFYQWAEAVMRVPIKGLKYNVGICCDELEISREGITQHRALADVYLTHEIYKKMIT